MKKRNQLLVLVLLFTLILSLAAFAEEGRFLKVTAYGVNIRAGAGTDTDVIGRADFGDSFEVLQVADDWYQVRLAKGEAGWIHASLVQEGARFAAADRSIEEVEAKEPGINVRGGASTSFEVVTTIGPGTRYLLLQKSGDWVQIRLPDERTGWVAAWLVNLSENKVKSTASSERQQATVIASQLNVRRAASLSSEVIGTLQQNEIVQVRTVREEGWLQIEYGEGVGYIASEYVRLPGQSVQSATTSPLDSSQPTLTLKAQVNLRTGPGTNFPVIETARTGSQFSILAKSGAWYQIAAGSEQKAWVAGWLVEVNGSLSDIREEQPTLDSSLRGKTIVLDAGHGGIDIGAIGRASGAFEKDLNLSLAQMLANKLITTGAHVVMTRADDRFLSLQERVEIAEDNRADLFVSLHYNTHQDPSLSGSITFYHSDAGEDRRAAERVQQELVRSLGLPDLGARFGDYYVLRENQTPAILVETAFLTHAEDERHATDLAAQEKAAEGIFRGIVAVFEE